MAKIKNPERLITDIRSVTQVLAAFAQTNTALDKAKVDDRLRQVDAALAVIEPILADAVKPKPTNPIVAALKRIKF